MKEKLPSNVDMNKLEGAILGRIEFQVNVISPTPHYPYWRYLCPRCRKFWEKREKLPDFRQHCVVCREKELEEQRNG